MVCIETILSKMARENNIKSTLCGIGSKVIIKYLIQAEIEVTLISQSYKYIKDIERQEIINGLDGIEKSKIIESLHSEDIDGNYIKSLSKILYIIKLPYERYFATKLVDTFKDKEKCKNLFGKSGSLVKKLGWQLNRAYQLRSELVHSGEIDEILIHTNLNLAYIGAVSLLNRCIDNINEGDDDEQIKIKLDIEEIGRELMRWINDICID